MIRRFYINMSQKGQFKRQLKDRIDLVKFYETDKKTVQVIEFDTCKIGRYFKDNYDSCFLYILGISDNNLHKDRNLKKECTIEFNYKEAIITQ